MRRPNILFINTDQQSWDALSAYGNPWIRTPNMDRMAARGVNFMRAYCSDPVCVASRSSWMTGRYSSEAGVPMIGGWLHDDLPDLGQLLSAGGYHASHAGKWHIPGRDVRRSFNSLFYGQAPMGAGGAEMYDPTTTRAAIDFLATYDGAAPFYLQIGLVNPHDICEWAHGHETKTIPGPIAQGLVTEDELPPLPPNFDYDEAETMVQRVFRRGKNPVIHSRTMAAAREWDELHWRFLRWHLYRFAEKVDLEIGLILDVLAASPHAADTLVIFTSDHGESAGCHRMIQKFTLYEESIRVPFIVCSFGDRFGIHDGRQDREHLISGVDLLPTVLDYAGIVPPAACRGRSIRPLIANRSVPWRDHLLAESNIWGRAVIGPRFKYVTEYRPDLDETVPPGPDASRLGLEQLFDLTTDPHETRNLAGDAALREEQDTLRRALLEIEATLDRRPLSEATADRMQLLAGRLQDAWQAQEAGVAR